MKSVILYPYGPLTGGTRCCRMLHAKNLAITSAIYTIVSVCGGGLPQGAYTQCDKYVIWFSLVANVRYEKKKPRIKTGARNQ